MTHFEPRKTRSRRNEIRADVRRYQPAPLVTVSEQLRQPRVWLIFAVAAGFAVVCASLLMLRPKVMALRPGQTPHADVLSRVEFTLLNPQQLQRARDEVREREPRIYAAAERDPFETLERKLRALPQEVEPLSLEQLDRPLRDVLDSTTLTRLREIAQTQDPTWDEAVRRYVASIRELNLVLLPAGSRTRDWQRTVRLPDGRVVSTDRTFSPPTTYAPEADNGSAGQTQAARDAMRDQLERQLQPAAAEAFSPLIYPKILALSLRLLGPTHVVDEAATAKAREAAAERVPDAAGHVVYKPGQTLVPAGRMVASEDWQLLRAENTAFREQKVGSAVWGERVGLAGCVVLITIGLGLYIARYQPRVLQNPVRAAGLALLLVGALLLAQLAGLGTGNLTLLGIAPVMLAAMTLCVAYDGRFALGVGGMLALLVTLGLNAGVGFLLILFTGLVTCAFLLREVRSRSKLIEVGGMTALALAVAAITVGLVQMEGLRYTLLQAAYAALAGLGSGFIVLGVLPFIERVFHITTGMTLLEYQNHPLLRRLALEAPGTYNHSLQVASMAEEAATVIGADALLCRVASYYHDIGKLRKPDYYIENQSSGENRHLNLNPNMSLMVILSHVKDGVEMAKEYGLPRAFVPFIREHHGTTLVEYFYREACQRQQQKLAEGRHDAGKSVEDCDFRYPGPSPRSRETAIVMMCDTCESACRAMSDPTPVRIEGRVEDLFKKRLLDGQFDECPLTVRELDLVRKSITKSLAAIYHGRIQYPEDKTAATPSPATRDAASASEENAASQRVG